MLPRTRSLFRFALALGPLCGVSAAEDLDLFEKKIRPVLISECVECHGAEKQKGGLRVDFRDGLRKGGDTGPAIVPGDPGKSLLLAAIKHVDRDLAMPQKRPKLSDSTIADFERWISQNAPDPRDEPPREVASIPWQRLFAERKAWWCFQPVRSIAPPAIADTAWSTHPVDRFLRAAMDSRGITPARETDPRTLIRRLTYVLTGLPPTAAEVQQFERNPSVPDAIDRLLDSPHFGEHWTRHWMDLVRYAETHGSEGDPEIPWAYRYRDYLIAAFNNDIPCDQLIREHVAGDLLPKPRWNTQQHINESAIGTTHLRLVEHGFQPVDALDEQVKTIDSQIDVVMKAFQGLTVTCARCHDHKFDAISQRDYYALYGVFASCRPAIVTIDEPAHLRPHAGEMAALKANIREHLANAWLAEARRLPERIEHAQSTAPTLGPFPPESPLSIGDAWHRALFEAEKDDKHPLRAIIKPDTRPPPANDPPHGVAWDLANADHYRHWLRHGPGLPESPFTAGDFTIAPSGLRLLTSLLPRGVHTHTLSARHHGILQSPRFRVDSNFISIHAAGSGGAKVRLVVDNYPLGDGGIFPSAALDRDRPGWIKIDVKYRRGSLAYLEFATRKDHSRGDRRAPDSAPSWFAVDKIVFHDEDKPLGRSQPALISSPGDLRDQLTRAIEQWKSGALEESGCALLGEFIRRELLPTAISELPAVAEPAAKYRKLESEVPAPYRITGVLELEGIDAPFLPRGDHLKPGEQVPRGFLSAINGDAFFPAKGPEASRASGRLALADSLTDPRNPLTARVMVNRVWHWLFGRGIVATPDNFGKMGEQPSHPELLDFLAAKFAAPESADGFAWSFKKLVRYLATTRTFALSSERPPGAAGQDPANALLTHAHVRRLEAESIRDSLLALSAQLDRTPFGPSDDAHAPPDKQRRRSLYLAVRRNALSPFLTAFDAPKPFSTLGRRDQTNVPGQSLTMLNDPLVHHCAEQWATHLLGVACTTPEERIGAMWLSALARPPSEGETAAALRYLADLRSSPERRSTAILQDHPAWRDLALSLFNIKEFLYLR